MLTWISLQAGGIVAVAPYELYGSPWKLIFLAVAASLWIGMAPRVNQDAIYVHTNRQLWSGVYLGAGFVGFLLWLLLPMYVLGLAAFAVMVIGAAIAYILHRNGLVEPEEKLLSKEWFAALKEKRGKKKLDTHTRLKMYDSSGTPVHLSEEEQTDKVAVESYNLTQDLLFDLARRRASEMDVRPEGMQSRVLMLIDGVVHNRPPLPTAQSEKIIQFIKSRAGLDVEQRRQPQRGKITVDLAGSPVEMQVLTAGTNEGQRMQIRVASEMLQTKLEMLGLSDDVKEQLHGMMDRPGVIIISGPPKSGVTSTLYSVLKKHDPYMKLLMTVEQKVVQDMENITQYEYEEPANLPQRLATTARRDPDVILVDQCPDSKTAETICEFAQEKSILLGIKARDSFTALAKWVQVNADRKTGMKALKGVLCQQLLRKICPTCREPYRPDHQLLSKLNLAGEDTDVFYRPPTNKPRDKHGNIIPCNTCHDSGYYGREAVFELLEITDDIRQAVVEGKSLKEIKNLARRNGMLYLQEQAIRKVAHGVTSIKEVVRALQSSGKKEGRS